MGFERGHLFGKVELDIYVQTGFCAFRFITDLPAQSAWRHVSTLAPMFTRRPVEVNLSSLIKGRVYSIELVPTGITTFYGARVWARPLPDGKWDWFPLPVVETPEAWTRIQLPITPTPDEYQRIMLPIEPTPDEWSRVQLPIPPTPDEWSRIPLPIRPTQDITTWREIERDE
jgi:hypothetical protein